MGKSCWLDVLISLNENLAKLYAVANNGKCIQLKNNNEKGFLCSLCNDRGSCGRPPVRRAYGLPPHPRWCCRPSLPTGHPGSLHSYARPSLLLLSLPAALLLRAALRALTVNLSVFSLLRVFPNFLLTQVPDLFMVWPLNEIKINAHRHL